MNEHLKSELSLIKNPKLNTEDLDKNKGSYKYNLFLFLGFWGADAITTQIGLNMGSSETNPFLSRVIEQWGMNGLHLVRGLGAITIISYFELARLKKGYTQAANFSRRFNLGYAYIPAVNVIQQAYLQNLS